MPQHPLNHSLKARGITRSEEACTVRPNTIEINLPGHETRLQARNHVNPRSELLFLIYQA